MYAVIKTGGKQYKVAEGDVLSVEKLNGEPGDTVEFDVIFLNDGKKITTDAAALEKTKVTGEILEQYRGKKVVIFKFKKRKNYRRKRGHRQSLTRVRIGAIAGAKKPAAKKAAAKPKAEPAEQEA